MYFFQKHNAIFNWCLLLTLVIFSSCQKEAITIDQAQETESSQVLEFRTTDDSILEQIEFDGEMFVFDSWEEFAAVEAYLVDLVSEYNETFAEPHNNLSDEAYNDLVNDLGFDEFQPLTDFEQQFGISSKRQQINEQVNEWLAESGEELDMNTYPDHFPILSQEARALFNENGAIKTGGIIIQVDDITTAPFFACKEEGYNRSFQYFASPFGNTLFMIQTSTVYKWWTSNLLQRAETSTLAFQFGGAWQPFRMRMTTQIGGNFIDQCENYKTLPFLVKRSDTFARFSQQSVFFQKYRPYYPKFIQCQIGAKFGNGQYAMSHCLF